jgi:hypothetical protein
MRITATSAAAAAHFAWQHDRPHVWDGLILPHLAQVHGRAFHPFVGGGGPRMTTPATSRGGREARPGRDHLRSRGLLPADGTQGGADRRIRKVHQALIWLAQLQNEEDRAGD